MALKVGNSLKKFALADHADLDCGDFSLRIRQAATHNDAFRAAVTKRTLQNRRKSLVPSEGTLTGDFQQDARLFAELVVVGWGEKDGQPHPLIDDDGAPVPFNADNVFELFTGSEEGKVLFNKVVLAAVDDRTFLKGQDLKNS